MTHSNKTHRVRVDTAGRIVLPSTLRMGLGINSGDELLIREELGGIRLETFAQALGAAQDFFVSQMVAAERTKQLPDASSSAQEADG